MTPTPRFRQLCVGVAFSLVGSIAACNELAKNRPIESEAGAAGAASHDDDIADGGQSPHAGATSAAGASGANDSSYAGYGTDGATCLPGLTRCHGELGFQRCEPGGVWGESQTCGGYSENGTSSYCAVVDSGGEPWAACVDPACWWWLESGWDGANENAGVCVGGDSIRVCHADGILSRAMPCEGVCRVVEELDGRSLGYCDPECEEGERSCLVGPLYRECVAGVWSTQTRACEGGAECLPLASGNRADIKCGGACETGTSRCAPGGAAVETCDDEREWKPLKDCLLGRCVRAGAQAQCQTECAPGEHACGFDGDDSELLCSEAGLWAAPTPCAEGSVCRTGIRGALGCLSCVGSEVPSGNAWGVADSRCEGDALAACGADNQFGAPVDCPAGQSCQQLERGAAVLAYCE